MTLQDGFPFTVECGGGQRSRTAAASAIPIPPARTGSCRQTSARRTRWFNTDAFVDRNPAGGPFRYGTVARNSLIGPGIVSIDASANKRFTLTGATYAELRDRGLQPAEPSDLEPAWHARCGRRPSA